MEKTVRVGGGKAKETIFNNKLPVTLIAGTCALESREITLRTAEKIADICQKLGWGLVYKGSFDKANRLSLGSGRGLGLEEGLKLLEEVRREFGLPVLTDVHESGQVTAVAAVVDVVQIPAFLARQTDLLLACGQAVAGRPGKAVNIKKGQFMAPADMAPAAAKIASCGTEAVILTERGTSFGYNNLVVDFRSLPVMAATGYPVVFDATHSIMKPGGAGGASSGNRADLPPLIRAAVAVGVAGLFIEAHPDPARAISDKETQVPLDELEALLRPLDELDKWRKSRV
jgi:2-dehydro-3-deoxyphosphooctonate aldolase (KDO 8-P synthase)